VKIISIEDEKYIIKGTMKVSSVEEKGLEFWKQKWNCHNVLKNSGEYYFCNKIITAEYTDI
jgi:hypothetical protein